MRPEGRVRLAVLRLGLVLVGSVLVFGACSTSKHRTAPTTTRPTTTSAVASTTSTAGRATTSTAASTTTTTACPAAGSTAAVTTPSSQVEALLTKVVVSSAGCDDTVAFHYEVRGVAPPSCKVDYEPGPFAQDASGAAVTVAGTAYVVVRCTPAYGYDFETGTQTYTGPRLIRPTGTRHVREVVETGDDEGVVTWVVGVDVRRPFKVVATGTPTKQLLLVFS